MAPAVIAPSSRTTWTIPIPSASLPRRTPGWRRVWISTATAIAGSEAGTLELAKDAHGFGMFEGQYGMVVLSKHEIVLGEVRTFRTFLWNDMPGARLPVKPDDALFYSDQALEILRLSSKSHWDVPVRIDGDDRALSCLPPHPARLRRG